MIEFGNYIFVQFLSGDRSHLMGPHDPVTLCGQHLNRPHSTNAKAEDSIYPICETCRKIAKKQTRRIEVELPKIKDLTFFMGDKTDDELWAIIREICRKSTPTWRAYERLHSKFSGMKRYIDQHGSNNK